MASIMNKLCMNFEDIRNSLTVLINRTQQTTKEEFMKDLESLLENASENELKETEVSFFEKIQEDCQKGKNFICPVT